MGGSTQFADPTVSRRKFDREIADFRSQREAYGNRGWFLALAEFPNALVILATAKTQPPSIVCGVSFDYSNYDAMPPSVRLVDPFTGSPYKFSELPTPLVRSFPESAMPADQGDQHINLQNLMQSYGPDDIPFLCVPGVREYHEHPAHSGDQWELYRASGAGRVARLLEIISKYGIDPIVGFSVHMIPQVGFQIVVPAE